MHIVRHLAQQRVYALELLQGAQAFEEAQGKQPPVEVVVGQPDEVRLDASARVLEHRRRADAHGGGVRLRAELRPASVDAFGRGQQRLNRREVRRRVAQPAPAPVPAHDDACPSVRLAQQRVRLLQLPRADQLAHARGRNRRAIGVQHPRQGNHLERARVPKRRHTAAPPMPEPKIVADHHRAGAQALHQHLLDERRRAELRERLRERLHHDRIDAQIAAVSARGGLGGTA
jgi:hypothetical protein